jgi:P4 family phage/plasmid primase-like protien
VSLLPHHESQLVKQSGIDLDVVTERGYYSLHRGSDTSDVLESQRKVKALGIPKIGWEEPRRFPGLVIPMYRPTGEYAHSVWRSDNPPKDASGKPRKYLQPSGRPAVLDVHPRNTRYMADPTVELWITEGVRKADALASRGLCVISLSGVYGWRSQHGTLGDWEDVQLRGRTVVLCFDADAATNPNVARAMARAGKWLKSKGAKRVEYVTVPASYAGKATKGADDWLAAGGSVEGLRGAASTKPPVVETSSGAWSDAVQAEVVADDVLAGRFCHSPGLGGWQVFEGGIWRRADGDALVVEAVRQYYTEQVAEAAKEHDLARLQGSVAMLSAGRLRAIAGLCQGILRVEGVQFDLHVDLLAVGNGVVDLRTGELLPHDPDLLLTRKTTVPYYPDAVHPDWERALEALPESVRAWFRLRMGQAASGEPPPDDVLVILDGDGENGKTTILGAVNNALGDHAVPVSDRVLLASPDAHPTELMDLRGARLAFLEETPEARQLSTVRLKKVVGTPTLTARYIRGNDVTWVPTHTMFISTNHRPDIVETDHATWRRLLLVHFPFKYLKKYQKPENPEDRPGIDGLRERCRDDPGIQRAVLAWIVAGAREWYAADKVMPEPPEIVLADTAAWRSSTDLVLGFVRDRLVAEPYSHIWAPDLFAEFNAAMVVQGHKPWSDKLFRSRFESHDAVKALGAYYRELRPGRSTLSRPGFARVFPQGPGARYWAWCGVRFRTAQDDR